MRLGEELRASAAGVDATSGVGPLSIGNETAAALDILDGRRAVLHLPGETARRVLLGTGEDGSREVVIDGWRVLVDLVPAAHAELRERARRGRGDAATGGPTEVRAVIPGRVLSVAVAADDEVEAGRPLLVVEAMKMQNELRAPRAGRVTRVAAAAGQTVELGDVLVVLE